MDEQFACPDFFILQEFFLHFLLTLNWFKNTTKMFLQK